MKLISNIFYYIFVIAVVGIAGMLLVSLIPIPGNYKIKIVLSGSMEPTIRTGGIVIIAPETTYNVGDVITFGADTKTQVPTTHRIVEINGDGPLRTFTTKGDANDAPDPTPTRLADIHGKVIFTLPILGYVLEFAKKPLGFGLLVGIPAFLIIIDEIGKIIKEIKNIKRKKENLNEDRNEQSNTSY